MGELARIDGVPIEIREPHTVTSLEADRVCAAAARKPWLCRLRHRREVVGVPAVGHEDLGVRALAVVGRQMVKDVVRCRRCGAVKVRGARVW